MKFEGTSHTLSMPAPPNKKRLAEIDHSLVCSGVLNEGCAMHSLAVVEISQRCTSGNYGLESQISTEGCPQIIAS